MKHIWESFKLVIMLYNLHYHRVDIIGICLAIGLIDISTPCWASGLKIILCEWNRWTPLFLLQEHLIHGTIMAPRKQWLYFDLDWLSNNFCPVKIDLALCGKTCAQKKSFTTAVCNNKRRCFYLMCVPFENNDTIILLCSCSIGLAIVLTDNWIINLTTRNLNVNVRYCFLSIWNVFVIWLQWLIFCLWIWIRLLTLFIVS